jgi:hypothetical protein
MDAANFIMDADIVRLDENTTLRFVLSFAHTFLIQPVLFI